MNGLWRIITAALQFLSGGFTTNLYKADETNGLAPPAYGNGGAAVDPWG